MLRRKQHSYIARVWNRHWGKEEKVGIHAYTMKDAVEKINKDKGKVLSISEVKGIPNDVDSTIYAD